MKTINLASLKENIESGILTDLIIAEESLSVFKAIAKHAYEINHSDTFITSTFAYLQKASFNDLVLAVNRIYDRKTNRNSTRCIESAIIFINENKTLLPPVIEVYQTIEQMTYFKMPGYLIVLVENPDASLFPSKLAMYFENRLINYRENLKAIKTKRDKNLAHNEHTSVISIKLNDVDPLLEFGWKFVITIGWAFLSTIYGSKDDFGLKHDGQRLGRSVEKTIQKIINTNGA